MKTKGDLSASRHSLGLNFAAWLTNIMAPARSHPSATSRSASFPIKLKLPTGAVIAGIGNLLPNSSTAVSGSATSWKIFCRNRYWLNACGLRRNVALDSAAPLKCCHASAGAFCRIILRKSRSPICSSGFSVIKCFRQVFSVNSYGAAARRSADSQKGSSRSDSRRISSFAGSSVEMLHVLQNDNRAQFWEEISQQFVPGSRKQNDAPESFSLNGNNSLTPNCSPDRLNSR